MLSYYSFVTLASLASAAVINSRAVTIPTQCQGLAALKANLLANRFSDKTCGEEVHESLRLTFHDAIGISRSGKQGGGADGSIATFGDIESKDEGNLGTEDAAQEVLQLSKQFNVSTGDAIQFAGALGLSFCKGAPRVPVFAGRPPPKFPAADGLVPDPFQDATTIIERFNDAGLSAFELVALLASHSVGAQDHVDPSVHGSPFDSTFDTFDSQLHIEVLLKGTTLPGSGPAHIGEVQAPLKGEMRLQSDFALARDPRTACEWQSYINDDAKLRLAFAAAMVKMGQLGQDRRMLTDCSMLIPEPPRNDKKPHLPAGKKMVDVEKSCRFLPFPTLTADPGAETTVTAV